MIFLNKIANAQTIFAPQGAVWNYYRDGEPPVYNNKYLNEKDTFYEGHMCSKIIGYSILIDGTKANFEPNYIYTSGDTVLYYHDSLKTFTPLYIFNVKVGDTLTYAAPIKYYKSLKTYKFLVIKKDTSIIDGIPLRNIHTRTLYPYGFLVDIYTERIGGKRIGNLISYHGPTTADHILGIRCYNDK
jgi:hypothetical protein